MQDAGPSRLLVVESCRWLCLVTRFVHVVACVAVVAVVVWSVCVAAGEY